MKHRAKQKIMNRALEASPPPPPPPQKKRPTKEHKSRGGEAPSITGDKTRHKNPTKSEDEPREENTYNCPSGMSTRWLPRRDLMDGRSHKDLKGAHLHENTARVIPGRRGGKTGLSGTMDEADGDVKEPLCYPADDKQPGGREGCCVFPPFPLPPSYASYPPPSLPASPTQSFLLLLLHAS